MRSILAFLLVLPALAAPAWSDVLLPGTKRVTHRLVLEPSELWTGLRIVAAPVRGVEGLEASVGIVTLDEIDAEKVGPRVAAAAAEVAARLS